MAATAAACKVPKFLRSLYAILQTEDSQIISWLQNHELKPNSITAFHILEMDRFEREVLPKYFKHRKFASFQRQLNNFGFRKWTKTQSSGVCTFSHNCFPPDPTTATSSNLSVRDQWRQKSTQVVPPPASATSASEAVRRRVVGNGIKAKLQRSTTPRRRPANVQVHDRDMGELSPFAEMYRSPNSNASMESNAYRHNPSHQPPLKKLARPNVAMGQDALNGLEAFCDDSFKQFILPPLQPHHLMSAATPRGTTASLAPSFSNHSDPNVSPSFGGFRYSLVQPLNHSTTASSTDVGYSNNGYKSFDFKQSDTQPHPYTAAESHQGGNNGAADAALQGTFLEPWMWDAQASSSGLDIESFPLEFDWQEGSGNGQGSSSMSTSSTAVSSAMVIKEECHQQDRALPNTEEFGLDNLLFVDFEFFSTRVTEPIHSYVKGSGQIQGRHCYTVSNTTVVDSMRWQLYSDRFRADFSTPRGF
ncbi:hypothetical protein BBO99_00007632 [Phytophthora kernoviae]|uniref:HSF-type DNA-binding domain-containing protein n=2 Tax=Phytophthora kernoviae TaxID=325452 RepID=A0A3R7JWE9_9STRA|nr:hypothetical protein G195_008583 [Phytophthora kernoviae 00238/432]KAG2519838.1 hypothetical protein JM16_005848 [Phytophthora kernoviae]KAG2521283.1 hypothetical protein JM18_005980 [Phytophthora kernoviae]RLN14043.1 hypothetical protein BBI17_007581 [Phytophthora kernoviae]RLN76338.1 hypothetical protein BBO99_00007632 [Phytophthora kernoviae]